MIVAVFDTNVLASGAIAQAGSIATLIDAWRRGRIRVVVSSPILDELARALGNPYFVTRLDARRRDAFLTLARTRATSVAITVPVPDVVTIRGDNLVLATAASASAAYLVTGDKELLRLGRYGATVIVSPQAFVEILKLQDSQTS